MARALDRPVIKTRDQVGRIERILNELRSEGHVRRDLLWELIDEIDDATPQPTAAAGAARGLLVLVEAELRGDDFACELDRIANLLGLSAPAQAMTA